MCPPPPPSRHCLHNHLLTFNLCVFPPQFVLFYTSPLFSIVSPRQFFLTEPPPVPRFSPSVLLSDIPTGTLTLTLSPVPLPSTGEWSLITVHGLCDEMPLAHLTSSCRLPLTSHCLCALQTVFLPACFMLQPLHYLAVMCGFTSGIAFSVLADLWRRWWAYTKSQMWWQCDFIWITLLFTVIKKREIKSNLFSSAVNCRRILKWMILIAVWNLMTHSKPERGVTN